MKFALLALLFGTQAFAATVPVKTFTFTCNLSDGSITGNPNLKTETYTLELGKTVPVMTYSNRLYEVSVMDVSYGGKTRYELMLGARDDVVKSVIAGANATFENEFPDLMFQVGSDVLLHCSQN